MDVIAPGLFVDAADGPRLVLGRCDACARPHFPAADGCPWCGSTRVDVEHGGTRGRVWLWTTVASAPPGYAGPLPYRFGVVELDGLGLRVVARLCGSDATPLVEGTPMRLVTDDLPIAPDGTTARCWAFAPERP